MDQREALEELFTTSLDAFVETRTRLAAALLAQGRKDEGQALKKVRRPSPSAWATNQIVRRARPELGAFLEASDRLRASQGAIVAGVGDRGVYQADVDDLRRATATLTAAARRILEGLGRPDDRALVDGVVANARTAALTEPARQALLAGALVADLAGDVDAFGGLLAGGAAGPPPTPRATPAPRTPEAPPSRDARKLEQEAREREQARELEAARRDEAEARQAAAATEAAATGARAAVEAARRRLEDTQQAAREAERALREAEAAQRTTQQAATEAETRAGRAMRRREALEK